MRHLPEGRVAWPEGDEFQELNSYIVQRHPLLDGAFGSLDGLNLMCQTSSDVEIENATYNGWLHGHFVSSVLAWSSCGMLNIWMFRHTVNDTHIGEIIAAKINCPGSWHDARVAQPIYDKLEHHTPDGYYLVADTAFPRGNDRIGGRIKVPLKSGDRLATADDARKHELQFSKELLSYRQTAEWGMRTIQGSFGRLRVPLEIENLQRRADLLETCIRLQNLRTRMVGINQIASVYVPIWKEGRQERIWDGFANMVFSEQRKHDRVSSFHVTQQFF